MAVDIKTTCVFRHLRDSVKRITIEQGGARSGKTMNILFWFICKLLTEKNKTFDIVRETLPALKSSAVKDLFDILQMMGCYSDKFHNKTDHVYRLGSNEICYYSVDDEQKVRGRKRDYLFCNEANEMDFSTITQLLLRTTGKIVFDYNPSISDDHWLIKEMKPRNDTDFYVTTYKDNPFLNPELVKEIERLQTTDENLWKIYGLGQQALIRGLIYPHITIIKEFPDGLNSIYGIDWGFTNDPTTVLKVGIRGDDIYIDELIYQTGLLNNELSGLLQSNGLTKNYDELFADSAEPRSIEEIKRMGWNIKGVPKGADSVMNGIARVKQFNIFVTDRSVNTIKEFRNYKWIETSDGKVTNKPIDAFNHAMDALRYAIMGKLTLKKSLPPIRSNFYLDQNV